MLSEEQCVLNKTSVQKLYNFELTNKATFMHVNKHTIHCKVICHLFEIFCLTFLRNLEHPSPE